MKAGDYVRPAATSLAGSAELRRDPPADPPAAAHPQLPDFDQLSDDPWERRAVELHFQTARLNRRILELEEETDRGKQRLREAIARLREAESSAELQAVQAPEALRPGAAAGAAPPVPSADAFQKLEGERAELLRRDREARGQLAKLRDELKRLDQNLRERSAALAEARAQLAKRDQEIQELQIRVQALDEVASARDREGRATLDRLAAERARIEANSTSEAEVRRKLEQAVVDAEQQAALYRKNLLRAEETLRERQQELGRTRQEREEALGSRTALERRVTETQAQVRALESRLGDQEQAAARRAEELGRKLGVAESRAAEASAEASRLLASLTVANEETTLLSVQLQAAEETVGRLEKEARVLVEQSRAHQQRAAAETSRAEGLSEKLSRAERRGTETEAQLTAATAETLALGQRLEALTRDGAALEERLRAEQARVLELSRTSSAPEPGGGAQPVDGLPDGRALERKAPGAAALPASPGPAPDATSDASTGAAAGIATTIDRASETAETGTSDAGVSDPETGEPALAAAEHGVVGEDPTSITTAPVPPAVDPKAAPAPPAQESSGFRRWFRRS